MDSNFSFNILNDVGPTNDFPLQPFSLQPIFEEPDMNNFLFMNNTQNFSQNPLCQSTEYQSNCLQPRPEMYLQDGWNASTTSTRSITSALDSCVQQNSNPLTGLLQLPNNGVFQTTNGAPLNFQKIKQEPPVIKQEQPVKQIPKEKKKENSNSVTSNVVTSKKTTTTPKKKRGTTTKLKKKRNRKYDAFNCFKKVFRIIVTNNFPNDKRSWIRNATMTQMKAFLEKHNLVHEFEVLHVKHLQNMMAQQMTEKRRRRKTTSSTTPQIKLEPSYPALNNVTQLNVMKGTTNQQMQSSNALMSNSNPLMESSKSIKIEEVTDPNAEVIFSNISVPPLNVIQETGPIPQRIAIRRYKFYDSSESQICELAKSCGKILSRMSGFQAYTYKVIMESETSGYLISYSLFDSYNNALNSHSLAIQWLTNSVKNGYGVDLREKYTLTNLQMLMY
jgi:hypothetical protein